MLINDLCTISNLSFLEKYLTNQNKPKFLITCLACAILFTVAAYVCYRRFWHGRQVQNLPPSPSIPQTPSPLTSNSNIPPSPPPSSSQKPKRRSYYESPGFEDLDRNSKIPKEQHLEEEDGIDWNKKPFVPKNLKLVIFDHLPPESDGAYVNAEDFFLESDELSIEFIEAPKPKGASQNSEQVIEPEVSKQKAVSAKENLTENEVEPEKPLPQEQKEEAQEKLPLPQGLLISPDRTPAQTSKRNLYPIYDTPSFDFLRKDSESLETDLEEADEPEWLARLPVRRKLDFG